MDLAPRRQTSIKVNPEAWDGAKEIFKEYGMTVSDGINLFLNKVRFEKNIPFDIRVPTERLAQAIEESQNFQGEKFNSMEDFLKDLEK
jgi:DNA-damage-inducible protein J